MPTAEQLYARVIDRLDAVTRVYYKLTFIAQWHHFLFCNVPCMDVDGPRWKSPVQEQVEMGVISVPCRHLKAYIIFTTLHAMQTQSSDENTVRPSVRLFVRLSNA